MGVLLAIGWFFIAIICLLIIVPLYILSSVWEMQVLKAYNYDKPWMAWIPFANIWALSDVAFRGYQTAPLYLLNIQLPVIVYKAYPIACVVIFPIVSWLCNKINLGFISTLFDMAVMTIFYASIMQPFAQSKQMQFTTTQSILGGWIQIYGLYLIKKVIVSPNTMQQNFEMNQNFNGQQNFGQQGYGQQNFNQPQNLGDMPFRNNQQNNGLNGLGPQNYN